MKALIIENDVNYQGLIRGALENAGLSVHVSEKAAEGLALAKKIKPDLMLLNLSVEGTKGLEFCTTLKNTPELQGMPILLLITYDGVFKDSYRDKYGIVGFLKKPFDDEFLMEQVERTLGIGGSKPQDVDAMDMDLSPSKEDAGNTEDIFSFDTTDSADSMDLDMAEPGGGGDMEEDAFSFDSMDFGMEDSQADALSEGAMDLNAEGFSASGGSPSDDMAEETMKLGAGGASPSGSFDIEAEARFGEDTMNLDLNDLAPAGEDARTMKIDLNRFATAGPGDGPDEERFGDDTMNLDLDEFDSAGSGTGEDSAMADITDDSGTAGQPGDLPEEPLDDFDSDMDMFSGVLEDEPEKSPSPSRSSSNLPDRKTKKGGKGVLKVLVLIVLVLALAGGGYFAYDYFLGGDATVTAPAPSVKLAKKAKQEPQTKPEAPAPAPQGLEAEPETGAGTESRMEEAPEAVPAIKEPARKKPVPQPKTPAAWKRGSGYYVQFGYFGSQSNANRLLKKLTAKGLDSAIEVQTRKGKKYFRVLLKEEFPSSKAALREAARIKSDYGFGTSVYR